MPRGLVLLTFLDAVDDRINSINQRLDNIISTISNYLRPYVRHTVARYTFVCNNMESCKLKIMIKKPETLVPSSKISKAFFKSDPLLAVRSPLLNGAYLAVKV